MISRMIIVAAFAVLLSTSTIAGENNAKALKAQMTGMAKDLESNDAAVVKAFILKYAISDEIKKMMKDEDMDKLVARFMKRKKKMLQDCLLAACNMTPEVGADKLSYSFLPANDPSKRITRTLVLKYSDKTKMFHLKN